MSLKELFMPDKRKIILTAIFAVVFFILIVSGLNTGFYGKFVKAEFAGKIFSIFLNLIIGLVLYYPLSCSTLFIFDRFVIKQKTKSKTADFVIAILIILIFNPFTLGFLYQSTVYINNNIINTPCGLEIIEFSEISPSRDAGMKVGEVIIRVDGENIINTNLFIHMLTLKKPGDVLSVNTNLGNYNVKTLQNPDRSNDAYLGIKLKEKICQKS